MIIPKGYQILHNLSSRSVRASVLSWDDFAGTGVLFWSDFITRKTFKLPFAIEQIVSPDYKTQDLYPLIRKGLGAEFTPLIRQGLKTYEVPAELEDREIIPILIKILVPRVEPNYNNTALFVESVKSFLLRREDLPNA